jgi:hypothetical protein
MKKAEVHSGRETVIPSPAYSAPLSDVLLRTAICEEIIDVGLGIFRYC